MVRAVFRAVRPHEDLIGIGRAGERRAGHAIADLDAPWVVDADTLRSKSQNAAIDKRKVQGQVLACYVGGKAVFEL